MITLTLRILSATQLAGMIIVIIRQQQVPGRQLAIASRTRCIRRELETEIQDRLLLRRIYHHFYESCRLYSYYACD